MPLLTRRATVQVAVESAYGTPAVVGPNDAVLVSSPDYSADPELLMRDFTRDSLSPLSHVVGRMLAKMEFTTELRSSGRSFLGTLASEPIISRLFRACGYNRVAGTTTSATPVFQISDHLNPITWTSAIALPNWLPTTPVVIGTMVLVTVAVLDFGVGDIIKSTAARTTGAAFNVGEAAFWTGSGVNDPVEYTLTVTTGGASGTAMVTVKSDTVGENSAAAIITTGASKAVGLRGLSITPTFTGALRVGQQWVVWWLPKGIRLNPTSQDPDSITLVANFDGVQHTMPGAYGTFEITAEAGKFATVKWTFWGLYITPVNATLPTDLVYEKTLPPIVELSRLRMDDFYAVVNKFTFNQGNDVQVRPDLNSEQGFIGTRIVSRKCEGGFDPEATLVNSYDFWGQLDSAARTYFQMRIGQRNGNTVWLFGPNVQYTKMTYADRNGIRTYDAGLRFAGYASDDELMIFFT